jgi:5-oxoprolinase (ATP-hydrolysing)/N-methylhydantoinase A
VVTPVFRRGAVVGLVGSIAHLSDIGGTKEFGRARELYEEGLQIPPLKLYHAGRLDEVLAAVIRKNVRRPEQVFGDIRAQVSSNYVGAQRLLAFMDEYRLDTLEPLAEEVQARSEAAMRQAIAEIPDGVYRSVVDVHGAGQTLKMPCAVIVDGDELTVDWEGAPPEVPVGGINCTYSYTAAHTSYALKSMLTPETPSNAGCFRPLHVRAPEGSVLNCRYPAAINQRTMIGWFCGPALFRALAPALRHRVQAFTGLPASSSAYGRDRAGKTFHDHIMFGGGQGGGEGTDGNTAVMYPTSAGNVAVEMYESRVPLLVERKEFIPDSAGAGAHRGGLAQRLVLRKLYDDGLPVLVNVIPHRAAGPVDGLLGGTAGREARCDVVGQTLSGGLGMSFMVQLERAADTVTLEAAGGSGFGDPAERSEALLARDLAEGYVTAAGLAAYGAEVGPQGAVVRRAPRPVGVRAASPRSADADRRA